MFKSKIRNKMYTVNPNFIYIIGMQVDINHMFVLSWLVNVRGHVYAIVVDVKPLILGWRRHSPLKKHCVRSTV